MYAHVDCFAITIVVTNAIKKSSLKNRNAHDATKNATK
jgi:hypothetical protein